METLLDYATLKFIWWALMGVLLIGFALTDGFDMGVSALLPFVGRTDAERRAVINTVAPTWEGNQVWFILGGGAIFAAWPHVYAASFSGFYLAMFLVLSALILRPVGFKYRSKLPGKTWRNNWDWALFIGGFVPALVFGVAVGNVLSGAPFSLDSDLRITYQGDTIGGLLALFTPFTVLCGLTSVAMIVLHGAAWLTMKLEKGEARDRAMLFGSVAAVLVVLCYAGGFAFLKFTDLGYVVSSAADPNGAANPRNAEVVAKVGGWLTNYATYPWLWAAPLLGFAGPIIALAGMRTKSEWLAFGGSSAGTLGIISSVGASMFPIILPSSVDTKSSLLVWNASSSASTLFTMLITTIIFLPIILYYTSWVYKIMFGRVSLDSIKTNPDLY